MSASTAVSADSALKKLRLAADEGRPYDCAIIDHLMPGTDGLDLCTAIRAEPWGKDLKLAISSSSGMINSTSQANDLGFDASLPKPVRPGALAMCLEQIFGAAKEAPAAAPSPQIPPDAEHKDRLVRILVAEDNHINQLLILGMLNGSGYHADVVANGHEALQAVRSVPYDMILMDAQMPVMGGVEATRQIRQLKGDFENIPIIAVTAHALKGDREAFLQAGMNDYVAKPINKAELLEKIAYWQGFPQKVSALHASPPAHANGGGRRQLYARPGRTK
jgi:CheY-like chemotaxis protein